MTGNALRVALLADIHRGPDRETVKGSFAEELLPPIVELIRDFQPAIVVDLGDRVMDVDRSTDREATRAVRDLLTGAGRPVVHLLGNHDVSHVEKADLLGLVGVTSSYWSCDLGGVHLVFLDTTDPVVGEFGGHISQGQLEWLRHDLAAARWPSLVFTHHPIDPPDVRGSPLFSDHPEWAVIENWETVQDIISESRVVCVVSGHVHQNSVKLVRGLAFITIQGVTETWTTSGEPAGAFAELTLDDEVLSLRVRGRDALVFSVRWKGGTHIDPYIKVHGRGQCEEASMTRESHGRGAAEETGVRGLLLQEILETPEAIKATADAAREDARRAARLMRERAPRHIYVIGNGTSFYSGLAVTYTARALSKPSDPAFLALPASDFRYFYPAPDPHGVLVGISASGEFRDVLAAFQRYHGKLLLIGITHVPDSSLVGLADVTLLGNGGPSQIPVMTKTYASTLTAAHTLLLTFFNADEDWYADLTECAGRVGTALRVAQERLPDLVRGLASLRNGFYFGAGNAYAAALEGALKMKEMALVHAEGAETWEMASGPSTMVGDGMFCVALYTGDTSDEATADLARHVRRWGARVVEIGPESYAADWHLPVAVPRHSSFASLVLVPIAAMLAYQVALARGLTPETPSWRTRYLELGMTHILGG